MTEEVRSTGRPVGLAFTLFVVFLILKLTHTISWSWWWVTSPLWISFAVGTLLAGIVALTPDKDSFERDSRKFKKMSRRH